MIEMECEREEKKDRVSVLIARFDNDNVYCNFKNQNLKSRVFNKDRNLKPW